MPPPDQFLRGLAALSLLRVFCIQTTHEQSLVPWLGRLSYRLSGGRLRFAVRRTHDAHHLVFFSRKGLGRMADAAGLRIDELWYDRLAARAWTGTGS